ncbi:MAG: DUF2007 domain-containing protein [Lachnospiraceae bacterium]|nr:DUF2007 domain-containing protein [Lachnospiraceae bacterium]
MEQKISKIFTTHDNIQAEMIINTLKDNNISSFKEDLGNSGIMNLYGGNSLSGENIYVSVADVEKAKDILVSMGLTEL